MDRPGAMVKGYDSYPEEYGCHSSAWVYPGISVVVEEKGNMVRILRGEKILWVECYFVASLSVLVDTDL